jgi:hypothetical protein
MEYDASTQHRSQYSATFDPDNGDTRANVFSSRNKRCNPSPPIRRPLGAFVLPDRQAGNLGAAQSQ